MESRRSPEDNIELIEYELSKLRSIFEEYAAEEYTVELELAYHISEQICDLNFLLFCEREGYNPKTFYRESKQYSQLPPATQIKREMLITERLRLKFEDEVLFATSSPFQDWMKKYPDNFPEATHPILRAYSNQFRPEFYSFPEEQTTVNMATDIYFIDYQSEYDD
jgi:hypothetical protein